MKNFVLALGALFLFGFNATAQIEDLMNDPEVGWIGEGFYDFKLDILKDEGDLSNGSKFLKNYKGLEIVRFIENKKITLNEGRSYLASEIMSALKDKKIEIFADSSCKFLANLDSLPSINKFILVLDPEGGCTKGNVQSVWSR